MNKIAEKWNDRRYFADTRSWMLSLYDGLLRRVALPGRGGVWSVRPLGMREPLLVRQGTSDWGVLRELFYWREYEVVTSTDMGDVQQIVDLGANVGISVRLWQSRYPEALILAAEPEPTNAAMFRRNIEAGPAASKVQLFEGCVAGAARQVRLDRSDRHFTVKMIDSGQADAPCVDALAVPDLLARYQIRGAIDLLKCDIEGAEREVFADCSAWIGNVRYLVVETHAPYLNAHLLDDLSRSGAAPQVLEDRRKDDTSGLLFVRLR